MEELAEEEEKRPLWPIGTVRISLALRREEGVLESQFQLLPITLEQFAGRRLDLLAHEMRRLVYQIRAEIPDDVIPQFSGNWRWSLLRYDALIPEGYEWVPYFRRVATSRYSSWDELRDVLVGQAILLYHQATGYIESAS